MITKNEISKLNEHILAVSGASTDFFGFTNEGNSYISIINYD